MNDDERIQNEIDQVIKIMQKDYPNVTDYNVIDDDIVELFDNDDNIITVIDSDKLTQYWNIMEGWY